MAAAIFRRRLFTIALFPRSLGALRFALRSVNMMDVREKARLRLVDHEKGTPIMANRWNRREMLGTLSLGLVAGNPLVSAVARAAEVSSPVQCSVYNYRGEPLPVEEFARFHTCDLLTRPFTIEPQFEPGMAAFQPPPRPFRIALPLTVPGFGQVFVYADNRGRGYTAESFSEKPLLLNQEFAADRLATVRALAEDCRHLGVTLSAAVGERTAKAEALLKKAEGLADDRTAWIAALTSSLCESLWAGEMMTVERAEQMIGHNGPRGGFLFGCNAFGYRRHGKEYADRFSAAFNFATLPFYRGQTERERGQVNYSAQRAFSNGSKRRVLSPRAIR